MKKKVEGEKKEMNELYYYEEGKKRTKLPFVQGIVIESKGYVDRLYFRIDSLPEKLGNYLIFSPLIRLDVGEEVRAYHFKGDSRCCVVGIQILEKGKVKFQATDSPNCYFE
ncbi:hypothetical protein HYT26_01460 [Candidatus Pacearchaeota archaeon]|nr:hypothetical protein [Candidatus Pacearchaeota archaeon]